MGYIALANDTDGGLDPKTSVKLWVSPDNVRGIEADGDGWDWIADGYQVTRIRPGQHDGEPATVIALADSDGQREVGMLRLRNDALRDARLEVTRQFENEDQLHAFVRSLTEGSDEIKTIELDTTFGAEETLADVLVSITEGTEISYRIVQLHGPGGGWPVVRYTGKDRELRKLLRVAFEFDEADIEEWLS